MVLRHLERSHPSICVDLHWSAKISGPARICTDQRPSVPLFPVVREDEALQLRLGSEIE